MTNYVQSYKETDTQVLASSVHRRGAVCVSLGDNAQPHCWPDLVSGSSHSRIPRAGMEGTLAQRAAGRRRAQVLEVVGSASSCSICSSLDLNCRNFSGEIPSLQTVIITVKSETVLKISGLKEQRMAIRAKECHLDDKYKTTLTAWKENKKLPLVLRFGPHKNSTATLTRQCRLSVKSFES